MRGSLSSVGRIAGVFLSPSAAIASFRWKPFSLTAFRLSRELTRYGVVPKLVIDVGANEGQFSRAVRETYGGQVAILGFEPLRQAFQRLEKNFRNDSKATFKRCAIGSTNGRAEINVNSFSQS